MNKNGLVKTVFDWDHFLLYLSGCIDFDRQGGAQWRDEWTSKLVDIGFSSHQILNPCRKPLKGVQFNLDNESEIMMKYRKNREWSELHKIMGQISHVDLRMCDKSDLVLVNMPKRNRAFFDKEIKQFDLAIESITQFDMTNMSKDITKCIDAMSKAFWGILDKAANQQTPTYGTIHEIVEARRQRKPVFMVWEGGKDECSAWIMWLVGHRNIFSTVDELMTRLENISKGKTAYNARDWLLLDLNEGDEYNSKDKVKENENGTD